MTRSGVSSRNVVVRIELIGCFPLIRSILRPSNPLLKCYSAAYSRETCGFDRYRAETAALCEELRLRGAIIVRSFSARMHDRAVHLQGGRTHGAVLAKHHVRWQQACATQLVAMHDIVYIRVTVDSGIDIYQEDQDGLDRGPAKRNPR